MINTTIVAVHKHKQHRQLEGGEGSKIGQNCQWIVQYTLDLLTLLVSAKTVTKLHNVTKSNDFL